MRLASLRSSIPGPLRQAIVWLVGWLYSARRGLRRLSGRGPAARAPRATEPAGAASAPVPPSVPGVELPEDAPDSVVARNEHGLYCVPRSSAHRPVAQAILQSRVWESETLELIRGVASDADIVHAGTFFGDFVPALSRSRAKGATVWAFEPGGENHRCTEITIMLNKLENVVLTHAGLDAKGGSALLATGDREGLRSAVRVASSPTWRARGGGPTRLCS